MVGQSKGNHKLCVGGVICICVCEWGCRNGDVVHLECRHVGRRSLTLIYLEPAILHALGLYVHYNIVHQWVLCQDSYFLFFIDRLDLDEGHTCNKWTSNVTVGNVRCVRFWTVCYFHYKWGVWVSRFVNYFSEPHIPQNNLEMAPIFR